MPPDQEETTFQESSEPGTREYADRAFRIITGYIRSRHLGASLKIIDGYRNQFDALEAQLLAQNSTNNGATRRHNERLLGRGTKRTKREAKKRATRSDAVKENPALADDLANGTLEVEKLDAIAFGSDQTGGAAAKDQTLIDQVKEANPDDANKLVRSWVDAFNGPGANEKRYKRQRRLRCVTRFLTKRGNKALLIEGDDETIDEMEAVIDQGANDLYHQDGGRDTPVEDKRSLAQREYDAVHQAITGTTLFSASLPQARSVARSPRFEGAPFRSSTRSAASRRPRTVARPSLLACFTVVRIQTHGGTRTIDTTRWSDARVCVAKNAPRRDVENG